MRRLSGGELQRVFIAGAVAQRTGIMLLDEPVSFLDPMHQEMIQTTLERIHSECATTLLSVTHDISSALRRNTHVLALGEEKMIYAGSTDLFLSSSSSLLQEVFGIPFERATGKESSRIFFIPRQKVVAL
jgi:iron complex transport system ATP-binding protein